MRGAGAVAKDPEVRRLSRFDVIERAVHWVNAALFAVLLATASALYIPSVSAWVGRREMVKALHVYSGLALPVPLLLSAAGPWGRRLRRDLARVNRWSADRRQKIPSLP